ncbi:hypothetical protein [Nonomuraea sp. NPDC049607]|uniref:hypothetical protein n=1 Tax=Nonomuraea sp. NPDC049607 TaxID=3154732 RepID=UPI00341EE2F2
MQGWFSLMPPPLAVREAVEAALDGAGEPGGCMGELVAEVERQNGLTAGERVAEGAGGVPGGQPDHGASFSAEALF